MTDNKNYISCLISPDEKNVFIEANLSKYCIDLMDFSRNDRNALFKKTIDSILEMAQEIKNDLNLSYGMHEIMFKKNIHLCHSLKLKNVINLDFTQIKHTDLYIMISADDFRYKKNKMYHYYKSINGWKEISAEWEKINIDINDLLKN
jgi:hypothetical protein